MTDIDVETGLPKLPDGYFWRIAPWYSALDSSAPYVIQVELRNRSRRRNWRLKMIDCDYEVGRLNIRWSTMVNGFESDRRELIREVAEKVYSQVRYRLNQEAEVADIESLYGDYPPKKLGA